MRWLRAAGCGILSLFLIVVGCSGTPEVQNMAYATSIGFDYRDGKWIAYAQVVNFDNIARSERLEIGKEIPVWIGKGEGETITGALTDVSRTSQMRMFWGHVKAIIVTENVMRKGVKEVYRAVNRYREVRYNILVFGTKRPLLDIMTQKSLLNMSPLDAVLFHKTQMNSPYSFVVPMTGNRIIANLNEPGQTGALPSIGLDMDDWREDKTPRPMFALSGFYFFRDYKMVNWMSLEQLKGMRWSMRHLDRIPMKIPLHGPPGAVIVFHHPKMKIHPVYSGGELRFRLQVTAKGSVLELLQDLSVERMREKAAEGIRDEIETTFREAVKLKCDPFRLQEALYRENPKLFRELSRERPFFLEEDSIGGIDVNVTIINMGKYKGSSP